MIIQGPVEVFYLVGRNDIIHGKTMFLSKERAEREAYEIGVYEDRNYSVESEVFDFVGKHISQIRAYYGFDYDFGGSKPIYDVIRRSPLYPTVELCKETDLWKKLAEKAAANPDKYNVSELKICSIDELGDEFYYGDSMEGMVNMTIQRFKVDRRP